ncbi:RDD family protein [Rhodanobacter glycinis]|uniref:RDD family protein n=1 Tax=Rhodanobacter glycinis TaxID=582702 RepID=UPI00112E3D1D|nr:RDD family protein [Rhodanobacter glycinis]TPG46842.1 RDD family protein [Rhodanobacter glycinis]
MEIWIGRDGERHGPYKEDDVRQWLRSGQVSPKDLAWYEGLADWRPLSVLFPDEVVHAPAPANPYAAPTAPLLPQVTAVVLEDHAGFWKRVAAYILDAIILYIPQLIIQKVFGVDVAQAALQQAAIDAAGNMQLVIAAQERFYAAMWPAILLSFVIGWLYFAVCESSAWQGTLGKLALGIRVTDMQGKRISFPRALGRYAAKLLSFIILGVGFLMVAWTQRKQGLHDIIAGTLVLNGRASEFKPNQASSDNHSFSA